MDAMKKFLQQLSLRQLTNLKFVVCEELLPTILAKPNQKNRKVALVTRGQLQVRIRTRNGHAKQAVTEFNQGQSTIISFKV